MSSREILYYVQLQMTTKTPISFTPIKEEIESFKKQMEDFSMEKYPLLKKQLQWIKDDMELILLESQERQQERLQRRPLLNKKITTENKEGPRKEIESYIQKNAHEFIATLERKWLHFDDAGNLFVGKLKKGNKAPNVVPVTFTPKPLIKWDHYGYVRTLLTAQEQEISSLLATMLDTAKTKAEDIFQWYDETAELFKRLGIAVHKVEYSFFAKEEAGPRAARKSWAWSSLSSNKNNPEAPTFKKIGYLMKFLLDNKIPFRANHIVEDANQRYQLYFYQQDITILISDAVVNDCFRDSTYVIKGIVPGLKYVNKEELKNYQGRKIVYNENRPMRIEGTFKEDAGNRPIIGEERSDSEAEPRAMLTDRATFIDIMKKQFPDGQITGTSYTAFAKTYNADKKNTLLLNETIYGNVSLLGLGGKKTLEDIKKAIFTREKPKLEVPKHSYFNNKYIKEKLLAIQRCEWFDVAKIAGSTNYNRWILELLRKAYKAEFIDDIKNKQQDEKKKKLEEYTWIKGIPLFAQKISSMLGGRVRSVDTEYQKMLRKRFAMDANEETKLQEYKDLQQKILRYETKREDEGMHPNTIKATKKPEKEVIKKENSQEEIIDNAPGSTSVPAIKSWAKIQLHEEMTNDAIGYYQVKKAIVTKECPSYRMLNIPGNKRELRLYKSGLFDHKKVMIGQELSIFGTNRCTGESYVTVHVERVPGDHKVAEFRDTHEDSLVEKMSHDKKCRWVINNVSGQYVYISLTKNYTGRLPRDIRREYNRWDAIRVIFDRVIHDGDDKKIVRIR